MKKIFIFPLIVSAMVLMLFTVGCKKSDSLSETWNWKGTAYTATTCSLTTSGAAGYGTSNTLNVQDGSTILSVIFNGPLPTTSQTDTVVAWGGSVDATQVTINLAVNGNTYQSTGGNGANQTINVTVSNGVVTAVASSAVELLNIASGSVDSSGVTFSVVQ
jgi:hypothetical protein